MAEEGDWVEASRLEDIPDGGMLQVHLGGQPVLLARDGDAVRACDALCPHKFGPLADGARDGPLLSCPIHEATFDMRTGEPVGDCAWAGRLPVFPARVRGDGVVEVDPGG